MSGKSVAEIARGPQINDTTLAPLGLADGRWVEFAVVGLPIPVLLLGAFIHIERRAVEPLASIHR